MPFFCFFGILKGDERGWPMMINLGILAHVDAGKTSLTEQLLFLSGQTRKKGSVDDGTAQTDYLSIERQRGISVRAASVSLTWKGYGVNIIDTPGHVDFAGEVERSLSVLDGAVLVISAAEGIQAHTEVLWEALDALSIPTLLFVNKIDRPGCDTGALLQNLRQKFSPSILPLQRITGQGSRDCGLLPPQNGAVYEGLAELDDQLMADFLEEKPQSPASLQKALARLTAERKAIPLLYGSMAVGLGAGELLDAVCALIPSSGNPKAALSGVVYQITHDKTMGKAAHVRLFGGVLRNRDEVMVPALGTAQKITQIRRLSGGKQTDVGELQAGDMAAVYGLSGLRAGDAVGEYLQNRRYSLAQPLLKVGVFPSEPGQMTAMVAALRELSDEDPLMEVEWDPDEREAAVRITGVIQLEVVGSLLKERYGLDVFFTKPAVIYRETPTKPGIGFEAYTMPKPCWAVVKFEIKPGPRGSGLSYRADVPNNKLFYRYQTHIETSLRESLKQGLYGWEVTDLEVSLVDGEHHTIHTHPLDFFVATPMALMNGLTNTGSTLLEPMILARITAPEDALSRVIGDVLAMRGAFDSPVISGATFTLEARLPVASSMDYGVTLAATGGRSVLTTRFDGYQPCPLELGAQTRRRGVNPLDRERWILSCRNALQAGD